MGKVGAKMGNIRWSWCGVNEEKKQAFFLVWAHNKIHRKGDKKFQYLIRDEDWQDPSNPGFNEQRTVLNRCLSNELQANIVIVDHDESVQDNDVIKYVRGSRYFSVELTEDSPEKVVGHIIAAHDNK
jgi:hypothetical protein